MRDPSRIFGLDGEMSGADLEAGHRLIQIGVACDSHGDGTRLAVPDLFCSLIGWHEQQLVWDERAGRVHNIPKAAILAAPPAPVVDEALHAWLTERGAHVQDRGSSVVTGFNVGAFDMPFVRDALPRSAALLSRRYADLNPLCLALGGAVGQLIGGAPSAKTWKRRLTRAGLDLVARVGRVEGEHDAGTDALIALGAYRHVQDVLTQLDVEAAGYRKAERARRTSHPEGGQDAGRTRAGRRPDTAVERVAGGLR